MHDISMLDRAMMGILLTFGGFVGGVYGIRLRKPTSAEDC